MKKNFAKIFIIAFILQGIANLGYSQSMAAEYLCQNGVKYYNQGDFTASLREFSKVLILEPDNQTANYYIAKINAPAQGSAAQAKTNKLHSDKALEFEDSVKREKEMARLLDSLDKTIPKEQPDQAKTQLAYASPYYAAKDKTALDTETQKEELKVGNIAVEGEAQISLGADTDDFIVNRANADLDEKNWRILSTAGYNRKANTFDTRVYDRLRVNLDTQNKEGLNFHGNITADPWSYIGKSDKFTVTSGWGDPAQMQLLYLGNTNYTLAQTIYTLQNGNSLSLPELKVHSGSTSQATVLGAFADVGTGLHDTFIIPSKKINAYFQPLREFWADYKQEGIKLRVFPIAYQDQAYTSDDPLKLSNNHIWWQESPWIDAWRQGEYNDGVSDFTKGGMDDSLAYLVRDSDGTRLTNLRGASLSLSTIDNLSIDSTIAAPKTLWEDYSYINNIINATRLKYHMADNFNIGSTLTYRMGFDSGQREDMVNYVYSVDTEYEITDGVKTYMQAAASKTRQDLSNETYKSSYRGNAYHLSLIGNFSGRSIMNQEYGYYGMKPQEGDEAFCRYRLFFTHMDEGFDTKLSNYHQTRNDAFWSRHLHFQKPFDYYYTGLYKPTNTWEDIEPYKIGDGVDIGRDAVGARVENTFFDNSANNLLDVRNVHKTNGKQVETVARDEFTYKINQRLTTKLLGIYQYLPKTKNGIDPFITDPNTGEYISNSSITDGKDPSLKTGSLGLEYEFFDGVSLSGIWEHTNDYTLAYDNFPRSLLSNANLGTTYYEYGNKYREELNSLYSQGLFPLPPYPFYDIWKTGLKLKPSDQMQIYLDYTRNEFKSAGGIDNNINHIGMELAYLPTKKLNFFLRYTYSRWNDVNRMLDGENKVYLGHHNFFAEARYAASIDDELIMQYGDGGITPSAIKSYDPFSGGYSVLDTRHIVRLYYRRKF
ncbi:MAG: hypothetical protein MUF05_02640 [Candidatus Omnitrophica bacterium]|jgi:hypothetical protein|nr:hypothetical protein [Candidatus Omnitrophota bacterium]